MKTYRPFLLYLCWAFLLVSFSSLVGAANKNGVSPNHISVPSGPGTIEGLGDSFQPLLNTGMARYSVNIELPEGVNGHTPQLSLNYSSGLGDSPLGVGWSFGPGSISRQVDRGVPRYIDDALSNNIDDDQDGAIDELDELDRFLDAEGGELVLLGDGSYRPRVEGSFTRCRRVGDHWEADLRDGSKQRFGVTPQARVTDVSGQKVYRWLLEEEIDPNGNVVEYRYSSFLGSDNQKYLSEVRYASEASGGQSFYFASFTYEDRPNWRKDYRSGFEIRTAHRLTQVAVGLQGVVAPPLAEVGDWNNDLAPDALIRRYALTYHAGGTAGFFLKDITQFGSSGNHFLPPISFSYVTFEPGPSISAAQGLLPNRDAPSFLMDNSDVEFADLNKDGLPDILYTSDLQHQVYLNMGLEGEGVGETVIWEAAAAPVSSINGQADDIRLNDDRVHLADMDGDGLADLVQASEDDEVSFYPNLGNLQWGAKQTMITQGIRPPAPFTNTNVVLADMDFDKRIDVVKSEATGYFIWFNRGGGAYSQQVFSGGATYQGQVLQFSDTAVRRADINGDRMQDIVKITATRIAYAANQGHGNFAPAIELLIPDQILDTQQIQKAQLHDLNADGLDDLVIERAADNNLWYWLNLGTDQLSTRHIITDLPANISPGTTTRWTDLNCNGTVDLIYADSSAGADRLRVIDIGFIEQIPGNPNLLSVIDNGLGIQTHISYRSTSRYITEATAEGNPWNATTPFPVPVVSQMEITTGMDLDDVAGIDSYLHEFLYRDPFYDVEENAFRGFAGVSVVDHGDASAPTLVTHHRFFTGGPDGIDNDQDGDVDEVSADGFREEEPLEGRTFQIETTNEAGDVVFNRTQYDWTIRNLPASALGSATVENVEVRFPFSQKEEQWIIEGSATPKLQKVSYVYDNFGNVIEEHNCGLVDPNAVLTLHQCDDFGDDERLTLTTVINDTNVWNLGLPSIETITDRLGNRVSETRSYYDGEAYVGLAQGQLTQGNLSRQESWVSGDGAETQYIQSVRNRFDVHGNITATLDPNADRLNLGNSGHWRELVYDPVFRIFINQETIHLGNGQADLVVNASYHFGFGVPLRNFDFNNQLTSFHYDRFGRITKVMKPGDTEILPTFQYNYMLVEPISHTVYFYSTDGVLTTFVEPNSIASAVVAQEREQFGLPSTYATVQYLDGLGRKLAWMEEAEEAGFIIHDAVRFNQRKGVHYQYFAYATSVTNYQPPPAPSTGQATPFEEFHYDELQRPLTQFHAATVDNGITQKSYHYDPLEVEHTDENGHIKRFFTDGLGRTAKVHEHNGTEVYVTTYAYNPLDRLLQINDAQNNQKTMLYDGLQRLTESQDPDRGRMQYVYDPASNLIQTTDNKLQVIDYQYDGANRMISEDYLDAANRTPDVAYLYDTPSIDYPDTTNTRGRLASIEDLAGAEFVSYDARGNINSKVKRIMHQGQSTDYPFTYTYDAMDRVTSMTWPNQKEVEYLYNARRLLDSISGVVPQIDYEPSGKLARCVYENGLETQYHYDERERLTGLQVVDPEDPSDPIQHLTYFKDGFGNMVDITDGRQDLLPISPKAATQQFTYDDLNRVTQATGSYGQIDFSYDKIGNLSSKHSPSAPSPLHVSEPSINLGSINYGSILGAQGRTGRLPGDPPGPHAVTSTNSGLQYDYDDNGNLITHDSKNYFWDFKDRLVSVQHGNTQADYVYDSHNQRTVRTIDEGGESSTIFYVSKDYEIRNGRALRYLYVGNQRVAQIEETDVIPPSSLHFEAGWNFFSLSQEPNTPDINAFLAPLTGQFTQVLSFDASTDEYLSYVPGAANNDFSELHAGIGYLIEMGEAADLSLVGKLDQDSSATSLSLEEGWNLIPSPAICNESSCNVPSSPEGILTPIADQLEALWSYDSLSQEWQYFDLEPQTPEFLNHPSFTLDPHKTYWLKSSAAVSLPTTAATSTLFYHPDHLQSTNFLTNTEGEVVASNEYYPYGKTRYEERHNVENVYQYTSKEFDGESELMYYEARYYQATPGRFISVDPMFEGLGGGYGGEYYERFLNDPQEGNLYAYAGDNPIIYNDPSGYTKGQPKAKQKQQQKDPYRRPKGWPKALKGKLAKKQEPQGQPGMVKCIGACGQIKSINWKVNILAKSKKQKNQGKVLMHSAWHIDHAKATNRAIQHASKVRNVSRRRYMRAYQHLDNLRLLCHACNVGHQNEPAFPVALKHANKILDQYKN